jgi:hypothetical protein
VKNSQKTSDKIAMSLMRILREGPEVSFNGSPTVSPVIAALCSSVFLALTSPLTTNYPPSMYFLALSQAPPELLIEIAI